MPNEISIHDNHLVGYSVSAKERRIVFETEFRAIQPNEFTDVIFEEVLAYYFQNDLFGTIIFDVTEKALLELLEEYKAMFEDGWPYGWPRGWEPKKENIAEYCLRLEMKAFVLFSSYGMSGWIIAKEMFKKKKASEGL